MQEYQCPYCGKKKKLDRLNQNGQTAAWLYEGCTKCMKKVRMLLVKKPEPKS